MKFPILIPQPPWEPPFGEGVNINKFDLFLIFGPMKFLIFLSQFFYSLLWGFLLVGALSSHTTFRPFSGKFFSDNFGMGVGHHLAPIRVL